MGISVNEHSSIRVAAEKIIYFDPFRIHKKTHDADIVFFTHAHYDHFSPEDFKKVANENTLFVMPKTMVSEALESGIAENNIVALSPGETITVMELPVEGIASYNIGKPMHPKENSWLGYVVTVQGKRIYVCGDCDAVPEGENVICDIAMVPIGGTYTMDAKEAAEFVNRMKPKAVIPTHYGTLVGKPEDIHAFCPFLNPEIELIVKL